MALLQSQPPPTSDPFLGAEPTPPDVSTETPAEGAAVEAAPDPEAPAPEEIPLAEEEEGGKRQKYPSWSELRSTRRERDLLAERLTQLEAHFASQQQAARQQQEQPQVPDREEDPLGYLEWQNRMLAHQQQEMNQRAQMNELKDNIRTQEQAFLRGRPDYYDALGYLRDREVQRARIMVGPQGNEEMINALVGAREQVLINLAMQNGIPIPQAAYELARAEGWTGAPPPQPQQQPQRQPQTPQQRVQASQQRSQVAQTSLSGVPGTRAQGRAITRDQLMAMSEQELERLDRELPGWEQYVTD